MKNVLATLGAVAVVATVAIFALSTQSPNAATFLSTSDDYERAFLSYAVTYGRFFEDKMDYAFRLSTFAQNYKFINEFESEDFTVGINHLADWTEAEYKNLLGFKSEMVGDLSEYTQYEFSESTLNQANRDWRQEGMVTPVKNQGPCGSCWAFGANGAHEGHLRQDSKDIDLAEQQMVECSPLTLGCSGGHFITAWNYVSEHPLTTTPKYPYIADDEAECDKVREATGTYTIKDVVVVGSPATTDKLIAAGKDHSGIAVAIQAENQEFRFYQGGVIRKDCGNAVDHAVTVVGHGDSYHIVKNSWGPGWGEEGFVRIGFGDDGNLGVCGILMVPAYPVL